GFRRRNTPALVYRYFRDMASFFQSALPVLRPGATAALIVGANRTKLGNKEFSIDTPRLLAAVAEECGFERVECEMMDTYQRYDLHQKNSINDEMLVLVRRPKESAIAPALRQRDSHESLEVLIGNETVSLPLVTDERDGKLIKSCEVRIRRSHETQLELG